MHIPSTVLVGVLFLAGVVLAVYCAMLARKSKLPWAYLWVVVYSVAANCIAAFCYDRAFDLVETAIFASALLVIGWLTVRSEAAGDRK
jgi:hypothetical protein